jgi:tetratricopeptide (TPR) repeat protein
MRRVLGPAVGLLALAFGFPAHAAPSDDEAYARARMLVRSRHCPDALELIARMSVQTAKSVRLRAKCQMEAKDWPAALASLQEAIRLDPKTPGVELPLAVARFHTGDYAGAAEALDAAVPTSEEDPLYNMYRGLVLLQEGRAAEAAQHLTRARALQPGAVEPSASYYEGLAWARAGEVQRAREALDRVIQSAPGTPWAAEAERANANLPRPSSARNSAWAIVRSGFEYDSNVRLLSDDSFASDESDHDVRGLWQVHGGVSLLSGRDWAAGVTATYHGSAHFDLTAFDGHYPVVGLWYDRRVAEATTLRVGYDAGYAWYDYDPFLVTQQVRVSAFHEFGRAGQSQLFVTPYKYNYLFTLQDVPTCPPSTDLCGPPGINEKRVRNRDGWGLGAGIEHRIPVQILGTELLGGVSYLYYDARGTEYTYDGVGTWLGTVSRLPLATGLRTSLRYSYLGYSDASTYPDPDDVTTGMTYPLANNRRNDSRWYAAVEIEKAISEAWSVSLRYSYENVNSNVAVFAYERRIAGAYFAYHWKH